MLVYTQDLRLRGFYETILIGCAILFPKHQLKTEILVSTEHRK